MGNSPIIGLFAQSLISGVVGKKSFDFKVFIITIEFSSLLNSSAEINSVS